MKNSRLTHFVFIFYFFSFTVFSFVLFWEEIWHHPYLVPQNICVFSSCFKIFLFTDVFKRFDYDVLWCDFLHVSCAVGL